MSLPGPDSAVLRRAARDAESRGDYAGAERSLRDALAADPGDGTTTFALAEFLLRRNRFAEAEPYYNRLLAAFPNEPALLNSVAVMLSKTGRGADAIELWRRVHAANPKLAAPLVNIGLALRSAGDATGAVEQFERALAADPSSFDAHFNLGVTYMHAKRLEAAIAALEAACRLRPDHVRAAVLLAQLAQAVCDWDRLDRAMPMLRAEIDKAVAGRPCAITPWFSLRLPTSRRERKAIAEAASRAYEDAAAPLAPALGFTFQPAAKPVLSVGYISGDFHDHPILQLTTGMYRRHDRRRVRVTAYPVKPPDAVGAAILREGCDAVVDLSGLTDVDAARRIHADGVDILVDISGFNQFMRPGILAFRPAPVQVSYLNFAGTLSARLYDYIIGDPVVTPPEHAGDYLETVARVSHCYQINNRDQIIGATPPRAAEGLPECAFVFACFCVSEKIERQIFSTWMAILGEVANSVLWLFGESPNMQANLRSAASAHGIDPARLVFAGRRAKSEHLGRLSLADLHFDTGTYGAHTTGSDALWAGVPLVTILGDTFPARVGPSLVRAAGLPELVVKDLEEYRRLSLELARSPERLASLRARLRANRATAPFFDTDRSVRDLESLYEKMWHCRVRGAPPVPLDA